MGARVLTLVQASDLHFGDPYRSAIGDAFAQTLAELGPDVLVIAGDFTQRAKVHEYEAAAAFLERLPEVPTVLTPGNHDVPLYRIWERMFAPHRNYRRYISPELDSVTACPGLTVVGLDSTAPHSAIVNGRLRRWQIEFARRAFAAAPAGDLRVLVAHHHLAPAPDYEAEGSLPHATRLLSAFESMGVDLILGGHLHRAYVASSRDVHAGGDPRRGIAIVQSGTATSDRGRARERGRNSFNVIRIGLGSLEITHWAYYRELEAFAPRRAHTWPRKPKRWLEPVRLPASPVESTPSAVP